MLQSRQDPIIVRVVEQPVRETSIVDVLIGAVMPSVLAEISFVTNKHDGALLKTAAYRQQIAQALCDAILTYQQSLKRMNAIAGKAASQ